MTQKLDISTALYDQLLTFVRSRVACPDAAADVLHAALQKAVERRDQLRDDTRLTSWLFQIVRSAITDYYRKPAHSPSEVEPTIPTEVASEENENAIIGACLLAMLDSLPLKYREVLRLVEIEGVTQSDLAERLQLAPSGARSRVQRGRALLLNRLLACCDVQADQYGNIVEYSQQNNTAQNSGCMCGEC
jgi:RNA polymerase sigma-70 factor (ECF subfamily)